MKFRISRFNLFFLIFYLFLQVFNIFIHFFFIIQSIFQLSSFILYYPLYLCDFFIFRIHLILKLHDLIL